MSSVLNDEYDDCFVSLDGFSSEVRPTVTTTTTTNAVGTTPVPLQTPKPTDEASAPQFIDLVPYDAETMVASDSTVVVVGARGSGKTVFMKYLLYCMRKKLDLAVVFCPTSDTREEYEKFTPRMHVFDTYSKVKMASIYEVQKEIGEGIKSAAKRNGGTVGAPMAQRNMGIILDDCMFDKEEIKGKTIRAIMMNGRHDNMFFVNAVQYMVDFPKELRSQVDLWVFFPLTGAYLRGAYEGTLNGAFGSFEECVATFKMLREHECLIFDTKARRLGKQHLFFCKAEYKLPRFRVGADWVWLWYYKYMVRSETNVRHLQEKMGITLAIAKGEIEPPERAATKAAAAAAAQPPGGIIVRRFSSPKDENVPLVSGPAAATAAAAAAAADADTVDHDDDNHDPSKSSRRFMVSAPPPVPAAGATKPKRQKVSSSSSRKPPLLHGMSLI